MMRYKGQVIPGSHEPMVTKATFDRVQEILNNRGNPVVGEAGFEPATSASRTLRANQLRYSPTQTYYTGNEGAGERKKRRGRAVAWSQNFLGGGGEGSRATGGEPWPPLASAASWRTGTPRA